MKASFAIAPNFHCKGTWSDRLLVADGGSWRAPGEDELAGLTGETAGAARFDLFSVPAHMSSRFWAMLNEEATAGSGDFVYFSDDLAAFLDFKDLPPPKEAVCDLLVQDSGGAVTTADIWALINFGEEPVLLAWPSLRLRLNPGEGCRTAADSPAQVLPPAGDEMNVLFAIRLGQAEDTPIRAVIPSSTPAP